MLAQYKNWCGGFPSSGRIPLPCVGNFPPPDNSLEVHVETRLLSFENPGGGTLLLNSEIEQNHLYPSKNRVTKHFDNNETFFINSSPFLIAD